MNVYVVLMVMLTVVKVEAVEKNTRKWTLTVTPWMVIDFAKFQKLGRVCLVDSGENICLFVSVFVFVSVGNTGGKHRGQLGCTVHDLWAVWAMRCGRWRQREKKNTPAGKKAAWSQVDALQSPLPAATPTPPGVNHVKLPQRQVDWRTRGLGSWLNRWSARATPLPCKHDRKGNHGRVREILTGSRAIAKYHRGASEEIRAGAGVGGKRAREVDRRSPWTAIALRALISSSTAFVAVTPTPRDTLQGVRASPTNASALISYLSYQERCDGGLLVAHLETDGEARAWAKVFSAQSAHTKWLVVIPADRMDKWLPWVYFPLNNEVTIATYQPGEQAISFWQAYQATPKHKQQLLPSGLWTPRSRNPEDKETGGSRTDASEPGGKESRRVSEVDSGKGSNQASRRGSDSMKEASLVPDSIIRESRIIEDSNEESRTDADSSQESRREENPIKTSRSDSQGHTIEDSAEDSNRASAKDPKQPAPPTTEEDAVTKWEKTKREILKSKGEETLSRDMLHGRLEMVEGDPLLRRQDLSGFHLRCTTLSAPPRMVLQPVTSDGAAAVEVKGILGHVLRQLQEVTNFTYTCHPTRDGQWGGKVNGRWTGMIGDIVNGKADIAVASLDVTFQRSTAVDFLLPVLHTEYKMVMKRPTNDDRVWSAYTEEFEVEVWQVLLVLTPLLILALYFASVLVPVEEKVTLGEAFTAVTGALCGQSTEIDLKMLPSRLALLTILQLQVLLQAYYTCVLVSSLALGPPLPDIESISDVQRHPSLQLGFVRGSSITEYFKNSANLEYQRVWHSIVEEDLPESRQEAMGRVLEESYVFLDAISYLRDNHGQDCRLVFMSQAYFPSQSAFAVRKGAPFVALFNSIILKMRSTGLLKRWEGLFAPNLPDCNQAESEAIHLATVATPFLMLGMAMLISLLCLLSERAIHKRWSHKIGMY
ncbi:uncharacterized protein [Penaeus vannamei]|uniref:uncharacterized protein n=1 Tax=Penaeus vannamei TaxID=6689 RepID=UPI00387F6CCA